LSGRECVPDAQEPLDVP
jgi:hypothetical protein